MMTRRLIENSTIDDLQAIEWSNVPTTDKIIKSVLDIMATIQRMEGKVSFSSINNVGHAVCNNGAITVRYDLQSGKFVEVEHDEAR